MRPPLLTGQPAPVIPFTVLNGRKTNTSRMTGEEKLAALRRTNPIYAATVDDIIDIYCEDEVDG